MPIDRRGIGLRLAACRRWLDLSQLEFAEKLTNGVEGWNVARDNVAKWEQGKAFPPAEVLMYLFQRHAISADWILFESEDHLPLRLVDPLREALAIAEERHGRRGRNPR